LTVGICAYNEEWNIGSLLENLIGKQNLPADSEIIVVCSRCKDNTTTVVRHFEEKDPRVRLIEEPVRLGKAKAVNKILAEARGANIVFLSADVTPGIDCLIALEEAMIDPGVGISCGKPKPIRRGNHLIRGVVEALWGFHNWQLERLNDEGILTHASEVFCIRNGLVRQIPEDMVNDDAYMAVATKNQGYRIKFVSSSHVDVYGPQTVNDYFRQRRRIISGHYQVREATGKFSQYLLYSFFARPKLTTRLLVEYLAATRRWKEGIVLALMEIIANTLAGLDVLRGKSHSIWRICDTTKTAVEL
jgi:cellulose synthase/poly-beta-1,6-N-acetylglucosamine synthase-like glycosyltransferase